MRSFVGYDYAVIHDNRVTLTNSSGHAPLYETLISVSDCYLTNGGVLHIVGCEVQYAFNHFDIDYKLVDVDYIEFVKKYWLFGPLVPQAKSGWVRLKASKPVEFVLSKFVLKVCSDD
ncbi:MAG: hypothetical protein WC307_06290 [Candidatus Nanoarchaeia archaeon]|jgi:hypothetical protein